MSQSWDPTIVHGANSDDAWAEMFDRSLSLLSSFAGTSLPVGAEVVAGLVALHSDAGGTGIDIPKLHSDPDNGGDGWHELLRYIHSDMEHISATANTAGQFLKMGAERTVTDPTPSANNVGQQIHHTGVSKGKVVADASTVEVILSGSNADYIRTDLPMEAWTLGSTPPTANPIGTTPAVPALLMDATAETLAIGVRTPAGFSADASPILRLFFALNVSESANDDLDITVDMRSVEVDANEALNGTSTQYTGTVDIGANTAQYSVHSVDVTLTYNDATNPIAAGDFLALEFHLTNVTGVAAANFLGAQLLSPLGTKTTE